MSPIPSHNLRKTIGLLLCLVFLLQPAASQASPNSPLDPIPSTVLDPNSVSWLSVRGMTDSQFSAYFEEKAREGFMVIDIEVDEIDGEQRVGAVWQDNLDNRGWFELRNMSAAQFEAELAEKRSAGYRLIDQEVYILDGRTLYAAVWIFNTEDLEWVSYTEQSDANFSLLFSRYSEQGYMMIDIDAFSSGDGVTYSAVWVENSENLSWVEWRDLSSSEFAEKFEEYRDSYRMIDVESYRVGNTQYYAGIWVENRNGRGWAEWQDMSAKEFGDKWLQLRDAGYRLIDYEVYPVGSGYRYAGIWRQNSERPNWSLKEQVDELGLEEMSLYDLPGMSVAIAHGGQWVYLRGFGYADVDDEVIAHSRTLFRLASVSKAVAGALSLRLEEQGLVDSGDPSSDHIPGLPAFHTHSLSQTISNRSGIGHYDEYPGIAGDYDTALAAAMQLWNTPLVANPGAMYFYSTHAYTFLGASLEGALGDPLGTVFNDTLRQPYNLNTLNLEDRSVANKFRATLYNTQNQEVSADDLSWKVLGGGLEASAYDLGRFGARLVDGTILSEASLNEMWTPPDGLSNYALGWNTGTHAGSFVVAKSGAQNGARSYIRIYPDDELIIVVLTNRKEGGHDPRELAKAIGALILNAAAGGGSVQTAGQNAPGQNTLLIDEIEEPQEEAQDPAEVVLPVHDPVADPSPSDLQEPQDEPFLGEVLYLPVMSRP
jgi:CubicO group peptidase (beta-lactamase class C family)